VQIGDLRGNGLEEGFVNRRGTNEGREGRDRSIGFQDIPNLSREGAVDQKMLQTLYLFLFTKNTRP